MKVDLLFFVVVIQSIGIIEPCVWSPKQCGCWMNDTKVQFTEKIIGGFESIPHSWPWIVSIRKRSTSNPRGVHICGGTMISDRHVLTAAHCFYESLVNARESISVYLFVIGAHYSTDEHVYSDSVVRSNASTIIIHEKYNARRQTDDIAFIMLEDQLNFENSHLGSICLPKQSPDYPSDGTLTVAIGWGRLLEAGNSASETLQQVVLMINEGQQCDRIKSGSQIITQLCAGSVDSKMSRDTCQGDSGGPLMSQTADDLWEIVGVTSYGKGCGRLNELGVYTRVSMYRNWIETTMNNIDDSSSRLSNRPNNIFFNSAEHFSAKFSPLFYFVLIEINQFIRAPIN